MISKLPDWIWAGAWALAVVAGMINVVGFLGFEHQAITHLTGSTSMLGAAIAAGDGAMIVHFGALIGAFVFGCALSGIIVQDSSLQLGRRYGVALALVSALLFVAVALLSRQLVFGMYAAACAAGLQNAMVSAYSGAVVRTTHLSGMYTDLGISLGHALRGLPVDKRRLRLSITVISGFLVGGIGGGLAFGVLSYSALMLPAILTAGVAVTYVVYRSRVATT